MIHLLPVVAALKAYDEGHDSPAPLVLPVEPKVEPNDGNENQGAPGQQPQPDTFKEKLIRVAEKAAEDVVEALDSASAENNAMEET